MPNVQYATLTQLRQSDYNGVQPFVGMMGAVPDCRRISDASISAGQTRLASPTANWGLGLTDGTEWGISLVGKFIAVAGAGAGGEDLITVIAGWTNAGELELAISAVTSVSNAACIWGTDNTANLQAAFDQFAALKVPLRLHFGSYLSGMLTIPSGLNLVGAGRRSSMLVFKPGASANNYAFLETAGIDTALVEPYVPLVEDIILRDFGIDGLGGYSAGSHSWHPIQHMSLMFIWWSRNVELRDLWLENGNISGVAIGGAFDSFRVEGCRIEDSTVPGNSFASSDFTINYVDQNSRTRINTNCGLIRFADIEASSRLVKLINNEFFADSCRGTCVKGGTNETPGSSVTNIECKGNHFRIGVVHPTALEQPLDAPGPGQADTLGFEFWSPDYVDVSGNFFEAIDLSETVRQNAAFAVSLVSAYGGSVANVTNNRIVGCHAFSIECGLNQSNISDNAIRNSGVIQSQPGNVINPGNTLLTSGITIARNNIVRPQISAYGSLPVNNYPAIGISLYVAHPDGTTVRGLKVLDNTIELDGDFSQYPTWNGTVQAINFIINTNGYNLIEDCDIKGNTIIGTGALNELAMSFSAPTEEADGVIRRLFIERNTISNVNNGIIIGNKTRDCRLVSNAIDEDTVPFPYGGTFDTTTNNSIIEDSIDSTGLYSGKDARNLSAVAVKVRGQGYPHLREDGNVQLPAYLPHFPRAYFTAPLGVMNNPNVIAINSIGNGPNQGGWISVNTWRSSPDDWSQTSKMFDFTISGTVVTVSGTGETTDPFDGTSLWVTEFSGSGLGDYTRYLVADVVVGPPFTMTLRPDGGGAAISGSGTGKLSALPYALYMQMSPVRWSIGFGKTNVNPTPTEPWDDPDSIIGPALLVHNSRNDAGATIGWRSGVFSAYPLYPDYNYGPGICYTPGDPNGVKDGAQGMLALDGSANGPHLWAKTTDWGTLTGWIDLGPGAGMWVRVDADEFATAYQVTLTDPTATRPMSLRIVPNAHATQPATPLFLAGGTEINSVGRMTTKAIGVNAAQPSVDGSVLVNGFIGIGSVTVPNAGELLRVGGGVRIESTIILNHLTANRVALLDNAKELTSGKLDLADTNYVQNALGVANGGTGATSAGAARTALDVYSKAQVDSLINSIITAYNSHTHTETGGTTSGPTPTL